MICRSCSSKIESKDDVEVVQELFFKNLKHTKTIFHVLCKKCRTEVKILEKEVV